MGKNCLGLRHGDSADLLKAVASNSVDAVITDPPYGYSIMGRSWDIQVPPISIWRECYRVLKPGGFCLVMSAPRQDVLHEMMSRLKRARFVMGFTSLYWIYTTGFPKATHVGKAIDKKLRAVTDQEVAAYQKKMGEDFEIPEDRIRKVVGVRDSRACLMYKFLTDANSALTDPEAILTAPASGWAHYFDDACTGYSPRPAVEVIIVAMKPLQEKTAVLQALRNNKGVTWLDRLRIPHVKMTTKKATQTDPRGRITANVVVEDKALLAASNLFSLDLWFAEAIKKLPEDIQKTFPSFVVPKPSKNEREGISHITQKPLKLMSYLVILTTQEGDVVLDPFVGSGTTCVSAAALNRGYIGFDLFEQNIKEAQERIVLLKGKA